jgi:biotin transport system substrate-specific component
MKSNEVSQPRLSGKLGALTTYGHTTMAQSISIRDLTFVALFAALTVVFAIVPPIPVPLVPVPVTLQTLGVMLAGLVLGPRLALMAMGLYLVLALIGFPVLPGARSGLAVFAGPTGGFLIGFLPGAWAAGWMARRAAQLGGAQRSQTQVFLGNLTAALLGGVLTVYLFGVPWLAAVTGMEITKAMVAVAIFVPGDIIKAVIAASVAARIAQLMPSINNR